jgi:hypothetical protein
MNNKNLEIDLVYLWVDGSDPKWLKKKQLATNTPTDNSEMNAPGRYANNDELRYSLRSAEKFAPWIRNIYIVTDDQTPEWLNTANPKVKVIDHKDIIPLEILPLFNSSVIEYFIYKIPGLSEHFLFANDDMFFNAPVTPDFFFGEDGYPIFRLKRALLGKWHHRLKDKIRGLGQYRRMVVDSMELVYKKFGKYYSGLPHHNIDSFLKSDYQKAVEEIFSEDVKRTQVNRTRKYGDFHRSAFTYYALAIGHGHLKYVNRSEVIRILVTRRNYEGRLNRYNPKLFCLNDTQRVTDEDRKRVKPFLEKRFPEKSAFEK